MLVRSSTSDPQLFTSAFSIDFNVDEYAAHIDSETSHTLVVTPSAAYAWKHTTVRPSTCYIFPCSSNEVTSETTLGCFVPFENREPGLLLASTSGDIRFWDSILLGLSTTKGFYSLQMSLSANEVLTGVFRCAVRLTPHCHSKVTNVIHALATFIRNNLNFQPAVPSAIEASYG